MNATYLSHLTPVEDDRISVILRLTDKEFSDIFMAVRSYRTNGYGNYTYHSLHDFVRDSNITILGEERHGKS